MPPRIEGNQTPNQVEVPHHHQPVKEQNAPQINQVEPKDTTSNVRRANLQTFGQQQRDRIERFYGAGAAGMTSVSDVRLRNAAIKADVVRAQTFKDGLDGLVNYEAQTKAGIDTSGYTGAKSFAEVALRADAAYRGELQKAGFTPFDVRGTNVVKAADFLNAEANRAGGLSTLSSDQVRLRVQTNEAPTYVVRLVENKRMVSSGSTLTNPAKAQAWVASADELAGAKNDLFEVMRRIGYKESDIQSTRADILAGKAKASDWSLAVIEAPGTSGRITPLWDTMIDNARANPKFAGFNLSDPNFVRNVENFEHGGMDYDAHRTVMGWSDVDAYIAKAGIPPDKAEAFKARFQIETEFGANPLYTGDATTLRPDLQNNRVGGREWLIDNLPIKDQQRVTFVPLRDAGLGDAPKLEVRSQINSVLENPLRLRAETRNGALIGAGMSAVTSLPEVFGQIRNGDYLGATETFATKTGTGAVVGGASAIGDRVISGTAEKVLSRSGIATQGFEKLYTNAAARSFVQRTAGAESVATSQAFTGVARQVVGKVVGGSVVGGAVNGAFSAYDQIGAYNRGEVTGSQAIGTVAGEVGVGLAAGATGAAAGAAIGSIVPIAGTAVGAVAGFVVGVGVGMLTDAAARYGGVDKMIAHGVTNAIDTGSALVGKASNAIGNAVNQVSDGVKNMASGAVHRLASIFG